MYIQVASQARPPAAPLFDTVFWCARMTLVINQASFITHSQVTTGGKKRRPDRYWIGLWQNIDGLISRCDVMDGAACTLSCAQAYKRAVFFASVCKLKTNSLPGRERRLRPPFFVSFRHTGSPAVWWHFCFWSHTSAIKKHSMCLPARVEEEKDALFIKWHQWKEEKTLVKSCQEPQEIWQLIPSAEAKRFCAENIETLHTQIKCINIEP